MGDFVYFGESYKHKLLSFVKTAVLNVHRLVKTSEGIVLLSGCVRDSKFDKLP